MVYMIINLFYSKISSASIRQPTFKIVAFKKGTILDTYISVIKDGPKDGHKLTDHLPAGLRAGASAAVSAVTSSGMSVYSKASRRRRPVV